MKQIRKEHPIARASFVSDKDANESMFCTGCGASGIPLDVSHIIRKSYRPDLMNEFENMTLHCRSCHEKWDSGDVYKMLDLHDFELNTAYIAKTDISRYSIIISKFRNAS